MGGGFRTPLYRPGDDRISELLLRRGDIQAQRAANSGQIWGNALANVGQQVGGAIQQHAEQTQLKKQDQAFVNLLQQTEGRPDPQAVIRIYGPEKGPKIYQAWASLQSETPDLNVVLAGFEASRPEMRALGWPQARQHLVKAGVPQEQVPQEYDDGWYQRFVGKLRPEKAKAPLKGQPGDVFLDPDTYEQKAAIPAVPKVEKGPTAGSFEDYMTTTPERQSLIEAARKKFNQADDRPRISVNMPGGLTPTAETNFIARLSSDYTKAAKPAVELSRQLKLMETGLAAAKKGDMNAGQQAVLVTFQKILDPISVVRESEYFRSAAGQALLKRIEGAYTRLTQGGAGFTVDELEQFARLGREAVKGYNASLKATEERIGKTADRYKIPRELVITNYDFGGQGDESAAPKAGPTKGMRRTINGKLAEWDGSAWRAVR